MKSRVLVVEDDPSMCDLLKEQLSGSGFEVEATVSPKSGLQLVEQHPFDVVVSDLNMREVNGLELCARVAESHPNLPVVVITAFGSMETAIAAIRAGAYDFVPKPFEIEHLILAIERATNLRHLREEVNRLRLQVGESEAFQGIIGDSAPIKRLRNMLARIAQSEASVLIKGESGTGKELVARAIHDSSRRKNGAFVAVNAAAMPSHLLESELFGHVKGAFTDARERREGLFLRANGGTLLLDEIGEMPIGLQPKLLRALEERRIRPLGSDQEIPIDVRIIAATNRDLESAVEAGEFREDLYFRLNILDVELPPLRTRGRDILLLAQHFLERFAAESGKGIRSISSEAAQRLLSYPWPGNVRELRNTVERAVALAQYEQLLPADLPDRIASYKGSHVLVIADNPTEMAPLEVVEKHYILRVLEAAGNNRTLAARILGLGRKTLYRKLEQYGVGGSEPAE